MPAPRTLYFANGTAYDIVATIGVIHHWKLVKDEATFPTYRYESIISALHDLQYLVNSQHDDFIDDVIGDSLVLLDVWFANYGVIDAMLQDEITCSTMSLTDHEDNVYDLTGEESITAEEEQRLVEIVGFSGPYHRVLTEDDVETLHEDEI